MDKDAYKEYAFNFRPCGYLNKCECSPACDDCEVWKKYLKLISLKDIEKRIKEDNISLDDQIKELEKEIRKAVNEETV